ncbi:MAG: hypothetical protein ACYC63_14305 [Armatimonadota bacterium]
MPRALWQALAALLLASVASAASLNLAMPRVANTYFADEPVRMTVLADGEQRRVNYRVTDYWRVVRKKGYLEVGGREPVALTIGKGLGCGFYQIVLSDGKTTCADRFCVLPRPYEDPGDYTLFGLHPRDGATDEDLAAAAQMGVRVVRQNLPWPGLEPERGVWQSQFTDECSRLARKYGMQMMFVLGFTPRWTGEKPENYLDTWTNAAYFAWHPKEPNAWGQYLDRIMAFAQGQAVTWPGDAVLPPEGAPPRQQLPLAHSWELWNEADIMFYVGDWGRYNDLLHMAWAAGRRDLPDVPMIYGGSTGNFIAMGVTASGSARYCFDYIALHTGGDVEDALRVWYGGAQQIPWVVGAPRETIHTECYAQGRRGTVEYPLYHETPHELRRTYLTLKAWREVGFYRSACLGGWIQNPDDMVPGSSLLLRHRGHLCPTPLYPAFAASRKLLSDATEVGPLNLGPKITAYLFLKHGKPMLVVWSDDGTRVDITLSPGAYEVDVFGKRIPLQGARSISRQLGSDPLVIIGVDAKAYLGQAVYNRYRLLSTTPYGTTQTNPANFVWYVKTLNDELAHIMGERTTAIRLDNYVRKATQRLVQSAAQGSKGIVMAQGACLETMQKVVAAAPPGQELPPGLADVIWRLARIDEWLGEIADDRSGIWENLQVSQQEITALEARLAAARQRLKTVGKAADFPCAQQMLDRAVRQWPRLVQYSRRGTHEAILHKIMLAEMLVAVEKPFVLLVVPIVDFTTSRSFRKARVLEPGQAHTLTVWVYNYLTHAVSGTLTIKPPPTWIGGDQTVRFEALAGQPSAMTPVRLVLPQDPMPWKTVSSFTMDGAINVSLPEQLNDRPLLEITGRLDTGEELSPMAHYVNVGKWLDDPKLVAGPTPTVETRAKLQAVERELQRYAERRK